MLTDDERYRVAYIATTQLATLAEKIARKMQFGSSTKREVDTAMDLTRILNAFQIGFPEEKLTSGKEQSLYSMGDQLTRVDTNPTLPVPLNENGVILWRTPKDFFLGKDLTGTTKAEVLSDYNILVYRDPTFDPGTP